MPRLDSRDLQRKVHARLVEKTLGHGEHGADWPCFQFSVNAVVWATLRQLEAEGFVELEDLG